MKNAVAGTGWTDAAGTEGEAAIAVSAEGQSLDDYKKIQFPAADPYADIKNTTTVITFDSKSWYLIDYDSSTVTLLAKECVAASKYNSSGQFVEYSSNPTVKTAVDTYYNNSISADAKTAVSGEMFLLTKDQANTIPYDFTGKSTVKVYRYHNGTAEALTEASTGAEGTYRLDRANSLICVYANEFSTYAIGYTVASSSGGGGGGIVPATYNVTAAKTDNGTAKALTEASTGAEGKSVAVTKNADGTYSYTQPSSNVTVSARFVREGACLQDNTCPISKYSDANAKAWYHDGVHWALENGVMNGYDSGKFGPSDDTSRAMIVTMLWRMEGSPVVNYAMSYSDVGDNWFAEAVRWASANGIVTGYDNGGFGPSDAVTRKQLAAILYRYAQYKKLDVSGSADLSGYADASDLHGYAVDAVKWACSAGIVTGAQSGGKLALAPREASTRAVVATMLMRFREGAAK